MKDQHILEEELDGIRGELTEALAGLVECSRPKNIANRWKVNAIENCDIVQECGKNFFDKLKTGDTGVKKIATYSIIGVISLIAILRYLRK